MMKQLVRVGEAFPNRLFVAISLLLCLSAHGTSAQTRKPASKSDCASASHKNKPPCVAESPTGQINLFRPKLSSNTLARMFNSNIEVWIDKTVVGVIKSDAPLTVSLPNGVHTLELKLQKNDPEDAGRTREMQITVSAQKPLYFQIVDQGSVIAASELDACTALAVFAGSDAKMPRGSGTIYLYWPKPGHSFGFLDEFAADLPVFLDGKRVGAVKPGEYLVVKAPSGEHALGVDVGLDFGRLLEHDFILGTGLTRHFHIEKHDTVRMLEDSQEEAADYAKSLRQREALQSGLPGDEPKEACNASAVQAALSAREPKDKPSAPTFQAAVPVTQAAVPAKESKDSPKAYPSLAAISGNEPTGPGMIYLYWPKPRVGFSFLDELATDLPVFLDGKRIGAVKVGEYLAIKAPSGEHVLGLDVGLEFGHLLRQDFTLKSGSARHYHIENHDTVRMLEDSSEEAADYAKVLRQREVIVQ